MTAEMPTPALRSITAAPAATVSVLPATSRNSATGAVPAKTSPGKRRPVSAMKALTITKTQKKRLSDLFR